MTNVVYRHFSASGELLYIGMSICVSQRTKAHSTKEWFREISSITLEHHNSLPDARYAEIWAIKNENPKYNRTHSKNPPPKPTAPVFESHPEIDLLALKFDIKARDMYFWLGMDNRQIGKIRSEKTKIPTQNLSRFAFLAKKKLKEIELILKGK